MITRLCHLIVLLISLTIAIPVLAENLFSAEFRIHQSSQLPHLANDKPVLSGHFAQVREVAGMDFKIHSSGEFILASSQELLWEQTAPFASRLWMNDQRMTQQIGQSTPVEISAAQNPLPFAIGRIFFALVKGEYQDLEKNFDLYLQEDHEHWILGLKPSNDFIGKVLNQIVVTGSDQIDQLTIEDRQGNRQSLTFTQLRSSTQLDESQRHRLNP